MNSVYFFLPFILVASIGIYQDVFAVQTVTGEDFFDTVNPDGSHTWQSHFPYILNGNNYVPFVNNGNTVTTHLGDVVSNSDGSYTWTQKGITDRIIAKYADVSNQNSWTYPNTLNNDIPDNTWDGVQFVSSKVKTGVGKLDYKYVLINGKWKTQLEATNLSGLTTKVFGFDEIVDIKTDTITFGGKIKNLDNYNNTVFSKAFLDANEGKVLELLNGVDFDFDKGFDNLYSVTVYDTGTNSSRLVFDYRTSNILLPNETLIIDPTFTSAVPTSEGRVYSAGVIGALCPPYNNGDGILQNKRADVGIVDSCQALYMNFDTSGIGLNITSVTSASIQYDITISSTPVNCDWKHLAVTGGNNAATYDSLISDIGSVTDIDQNDSTCTGGVANNYSDSFNTGSFGTLFTNDVNTDNIISIGMWVADPNRGVNTPDITLRGADAILSFTYNTASPPDVITTLTNSTNPTSSTIGLNWTAPSAGGGSQSIIGYQLNLTSTATNRPQTVLINDTGSTATNYNVTGLIFDTNYYTSIFAWGNNTADYPLYNSTYSNIFNFTTTTNSLGVGPTNFLMLPNGTSTSVLLQNWTAPIISGLNGYRVQCEAPVGNGFSVVTSNTTTTTTNYNYTGLVVNTYYNCKVAAMNGTGITDYSNTYSQTTYHLPDAVTTLSVTMSDALTALLTWVQPTTLYGYLSGYQINYTTPTGVPTTIYVADTGSSAVSYTVGGLSSDPYSFRVSAITIHGKNTTSAAIANGTAMSNFEIGSVFLPTGTNPDTIPIVFTHHTINSTSTNVKVTYDSSYNLACDFRYPISQTNHTYSGLTENAISGSSVYSNFTLNGYGNAVTDIYCWDQLDNSTNGKDRIGTTSIPLIGQINSFQTGTFGTSGGFGALDFMTLIIVIISMIGFNRTHPIVGVAFMAVFIGVMTYYHAIAEQTTYLGAVALVIALAIIYGRRDDAE